jgi:tetratricopeptide (TPR) repeat protein
MLAQPAAPGCPAPDTVPAVRRAEEAVPARLTLVRCVRTDLRAGRWREVDLRLESARRAVLAMIPPERPTWQGLVNRLTATRIVDARAWAQADVLAAPMAATSPELHAMITALAEARIAWGTQDAAAFARLLRVAQTLRNSGRAAGDDEVSRAGLLVQAAVAGGQYERDEMQLLVEDARRLELTLAATAGELFVPIVLARELEADLWLQTDRYLQAAEAYRAVIADHPARVQSWLGLAQAYRRLGHAAEAAVAEAEARRLAPGFRIE